MALNMAGSNHDELSQCVGLFKNSTPHNLDSIARALNAYVKEQTDYEITGNASVSLWKSDKGQNVPWKDIRVNSTHHDGVRADLQFCKKDVPSPDAITYGLDLVVLDNLGTDSKPNKVYIARIIGDPKHGVYFYGMIGVGASLSDAKVTHILDSHPAEYPYQDRHRNWVRASLEVGIYQGEIFEAELDTRGRFEEAGTASYEQWKRIIQHAQTRQKELEVILQSLSTKLGGRLIDAIPLFMEHAENYARTHVNSQEHRDVQEIEAKVLTHLDQKLKAQIESHGRVT